MAGAPTFDRPTFARPPGLLQSVVVELRYEAPVAADKGKFVGKENGREAAERLNAALEGMSAAEVRPDFDPKPRLLSESMSLSAALPSEPTAATVTRRLAGAHSALSPEEFFKGNFTRVILKSSADAAEVANRLKRHDAVWDAYVAPVPEPPVFLQPPDITGASPFNLEPTQGYLHSAPNGVSACDVWNQAGAKGQGVTICDIEAGWNLAHQDLPPGVKKFGGTLLSDPGWVNHGTAVLGEMISLSNSIGTIGISHAAKGAVQSAFIDGVFNAAKAIDNAASKLKAGDVILIELHFDLNPPTGQFVAMQYFSDVFTAIQAAVNKGIVVVEAAGNGNQNFDAAKYNGTGLQKDCGAIMVGAGVPPTNRFDFNSSYAPLGAPRSRIFFSNYGKMVNVQAWGWHVSTTGYGDAGGKTANEHYTFRFSGTSSASPIVTSAVACIQGAAIAKHGAPLTPVKVRKILMDTGTPQAASPGVPVATNKIGPQPDLVAALKKV